MAKTYSMVEFAVGTLIVL